MRITEDRMKEVLHPNILESELDLASKKVLAALCDWYLNSKATESKIVIIDNKKLAYIAGVGGDSLQKALRQLQDYNLVERKIGTGLGNASQYIINFKQMAKPLKRKTFAELFNIELDEEEPLENPISTIVKNSILQSSIDKSITSYYSSDDSISDKSCIDLGITGNSISEKVISDDYFIDESFAEEGIAEETSYEEDVFGTNTYLNRKREVLESKEVKEKILENQEAMATQELEKDFEEGLTEPMTKNEEEVKEDPDEYQFINKNPSGDNQDSILGEVQEEGSCEDSSSQSQPIEEEPRPASHKELQDYFLKRFRQEFKERIPKSEEDIQQSREKLFQELESFSDISSYRLVGYMINDACRKETDRLMERILAA